MRARLPVLGSSTARRAPFAELVEPSLSPRRAAPLPLVCVESSAVPVAARFVRDLIAALRSAPGAPVEGKVDVILACAEPLERELGSVALRALGADRCVAVADIEASSDVWDAGERPALVVELGGALGRVFEPCLSVEIDPGASLRTQIRPGVDLRIRADANHFAQPIGAHLRSRLLQRSLREV